MECHQTVWTAQMHHFLFEKTPVCELLHKCVSCFITNVLLATYTLTYNVAEFLLFGENKGFLTTRIFHAF